MITSDQLDELANEYNKNKDKKVKEWADGVNNTERRIVSVSAINKRDDGTYLVIGKSKLHGSVRDTKNKLNKLRR
jgi:hypothetical protein